jgi:hypothetical protein
MNELIRQLHVAKKAFTSLSRSHKHTYREPHKIEKAKLLFELQFCSIQHCILYSHNGAKYPCYIPIVDSTRYGIIYNTEVKNELLIVAT